MSLHFHLSHPTTPAGSGFDVDLGDVVALGNVGLQTYATVGDAAGSSVPIDDPTGTLDTYTWGLSRFYVVEDECPTGDTVVWNGYVGDQTISRGGGGPEEIYLFGAARRWQIDLEDDNSILSFRLIGADAGDEPYADRPAENGSARLAWLLSVDHVGSVITDEGLIDWAGLATFALDANDYTTSRPKDVCADIAMISGYAFWCQYDEPSENIQLAFFDANSSTAYTSTLSISNVEADCDYSTVFPPGMDATLHRSPQNVAAGVMVQYAGTPGLYYDTSLPTSYEFGFRDQLAPSSNVKTAAKAQALTEHYLAQHDEQDEWIDARIWLPADTLTALKAGMRLPVKFSHFPGYEDYRYCRVMEHTLASFNKTEAQYEVQLKLSPQAPEVQVRHLLVAYVACSNGVGGVYGDDWVWDYSDDSFADPSQFPGAGSGGMAILHREIADDETTTVLEGVSSVQGTNAWVFEIAGVIGDLTVVSGSDVLDTDGLDAVSTLSADAGSVESTLFGGYSLQKVAYGQNTICSTTDGTEVIQVNRNNEDLRSYGCTGIADPYPPHNWLGYATGTGTLTIGGVVTCPGSGPPYNVMGRGYGGWLFASSGFTVIQSGFGGNSNGFQYSVTLANAPTPT